MLRLALAEDHPDLRAGLVEKLGFFPDVEVVTVAEDGAELVAALGLLADPPEVVLMDIEMPAMDGVAATTEVLRRWPEIAVVMLTVFDDDARVLDALDAGAAGYLVKETPIEAVVAAAREAAAGGAPLAASVAGAVVRSVRQSRAAARAVRAEFESLGLSERERDVLRLLAHGNTDDGAAHALGISVHTVRSYTKTLFRKLEVNSRAEAARRASELGVV
ncbi:MAG: response regulator transcription factor [Bacteroidota bacterium]